MFLYNMLNYAKAEDDLPRRDALLGELRAPAVSHPDDAFVQEVWRPLSHWEALIVSRRSLISSRQRGRWSGAMPDVVSDAAEGDAIVVTDRVVGCDGGGGALGHPLVYLRIEREGEVVCPYCSLRFVLAGDPGTAASHH